MDPDTYDAQLGIAVNASDIRQANKTHLIKKYYRMLTMVVFRSEHMIDSYSYEAFQDMAAFAQHLEEENYPFEEFLEELKEADYDEFSKQFESFRKLMDRIMANYAGVFQMLSERLAVEYSITFLKVQLGLRFLALTYMQTEEKVCDTDKMLIKRLIKHVMHFRECITNLSKKLFSRFDLQTIKTEGEHSTNPEHFQRILESIDLNPIREITMNDFQVQSVPISFWQKLDTIPNIKTLLRKFAKNKCSNCKIITLADASCNFSILDNCDHLICQHCSQVLLEPVDAFCPARSPSCNQPVKVYIRKEAFLEYKASGYCPCKEPSPELEDYAADL